MALTIEAVYENGVLKPTQPLPFKEHEKVTLTVVPAGPSLVERIAARAAALPPEVSAALSHRATFAGWPGPGRARWIADPGPESLKKIAKCVENGLAKRVQRLLREASRLHGVLDGQLSCPSATPLRPVDLQRPSEHSNYGLLFSVAVRV
jgi:predicted DNA-binding antitoxin AbrB/MazE fold protein